MTDEMPVWSWTQLFFRPNLQLTEKKTVFPSIFSYDEKCLKKDHFICQDRMTQIHIFSVGKWKKGPEKDLYDHFHARMKWQIVLHQMDDKAASFLTPDQVRDNQAEKFLPLLAKTPLSYRIALDEKGQQLSSLQLAGQFQQCFNQSLIPTFLIGGDHGLRHDIVKNAHLTLSFGKVTWPHLLVLGLLSEQLYRAQQILGGHPYHRQS